MMLINKTATPSFWILDFFFLDDQKVLLPYSLATRAENVLQRKKSLKSMIFKIAINLSL